MKHSRARIAVAGLIGALTATAGLLIAIDETRTADRIKQAAEFQQLVGGLGGGPAVDLSRCEFSFDPRLCDECRLNHELIPGGVYFCQQHACSILYYPPLRRQGTRP